MRTLSKRYNTSLTDKKTAEARWKNREKVTDVIANVTTDVIETLQRNCNHTETDTKTDIKTDIKDQKIKGDKSPQEKIEKPKRVIFKAPTLAEVCELVADENLNMDASAFINFYESKGWMVGKSKMKDWKAAARGWSSRNTQKSPDSATNTERGLINQSNKSGTNYGTPESKNPAFRDFEQERKDAAIAGGKRRLMERKANEAAIVLPEADFITLQHRAG